MTKRRYPRGGAAKPDLGIRTNSLASKQTRATLGAVERGERGFARFGHPPDPFLLDECLEEIARLHLDDTDCCRVRDAMLTIHQTEEVLDNEKLIEHLSGAGFSAELARLGRVCAQRLTRTSPQAHIESRFWKVGGMS